MAPSSIWTLALLAAAATALPTAETQATCADIKNALPGRLWLPGEAAYTKENRDYYNIGLAELGPACITLPTSAEDVSKIVKILNVRPGVRFAIKSGGHDPNPGQSSVKDGVLVALRHINGTEYDAQKNVAYVKPGGHWSSVIGPLAKKNVTVVSGRLGVVGIGGYLMQGGNSFLSAQHGLAADSILEWELVAANGSIITVNAKRYPDLARALRGGGDQFGICTKFTLQAYPIGPVWSGTKAYAAKDREAVFEALADFVENNHKDPKAAIIFTSGLGSASLMQFYDGPTPPKGAFGKFENLKATMDVGKTQSYADVIGATDGLFNFFSSRTSFRSITLPHLPHDHGYYSRVDALWSNITAKHLKGRYLVGSTLAFQPFPNSMGKATETKGGNAMGLKGSDHTRFVIEIAGIYSRKADDDVVQEMSREYTQVLTEQLQGVKASAKAKGITVGEYNPMFGNDAGPDQDVMGSYRDVATFRKLQKQLDPEGLFAKRAGGFKYPE
ncbi:FAD-binding domain-containing protein [Trichodelitschia bisporula]|uniref:FAD-binding domain-containing protein n=1 Tax=Trichodelitschia bisporula TaxID=703511 RepID=A0A6G1HK10_9PEZI|nr:FAD-binding domain-containing protein [Trichodelitschia bisporula]